MDSSAFDELIMEVIRPSLREVVRKYKAHLNPNFPSEKHAYEAIRIEYEKAVKDVKSAMLKQNEASLDTHKEAACLCSGIVKSRVLLECDWDSRVDKNDPYFRAYMYPNELFAFMAAMRIIKDSLYVSYAHNDEMCRIIAEHVPYYPGNITDAFGYLSNTIFYIRRFAMRGSTSEFLFDTGAYSTIFFHLDRENRLHVESLYNKMSAQASA